MTDTQDAAPSADAQLYEATNEALQVTGLLLTEAQRKLAAAEQRVAELQRETVRLAAPWLCDCHTWPGLDEAHEYIVALERERDALRAALRHIADPRGWTSEAKARTIARNALSGDAQRAGAEEATP